MMAPGRHPGAAEQKAADGQRADAASGQQRPGSLLGPGELTSRAGRQLVEEQPEDHHEGEARGQLERRRHSDPTRAHLADLARHSAQRWDREQQRGDGRAQQQRGGHARGDWGGGARLAC